jgi:predicted ester cyclase
MPVEDNKQAARRFYQEVINGRNLDAMDELLTPEGVDHTFGSHSAEQAKQFFGMVHQAFPDLHAEVHDVIAEGELVAARVTYTGTHQGEFVGIPATGKRPPSTGSTSSACRTAGRPSTGADRTCSASWYRRASCPAQAHRDQAHPPSSGRQQVTAARPGSRRQRAGGVGATALAWQRSSGVRPARRHSTAAAGQGCVLGRCAQATQGSSRDRRKPSTSVPAAQPRCSGPGWT